MKKLYHLAAAFTLLFSQVIVAQTGTTLIKKVEAQPGKLVIPYEKYVLENGLTVIISEDHSDPIVHVEVTYHVGSNRETPRRTGFAHFFEHMMFQGSQNVKDEEHFKIIQGSGGSMNGTTNRDRTNYFETVPSNMLETALWLEADRMGFLLPAYTDKKFENQRETVKNEKDQRYANGYGMLPEVQDQLLYPYGHPYSWQTIGYVDDLNEADATDLKNFFLKWYGPNNAIVVITGDVVTKDALALVEKYFGSIKKGPAIPPLPKTPLVLETEKITTIESKVFAPIASIVYPTVPTFHKDEAALDVLADLLSDGKNSVLYKNFIESENSLQASCSNRTYEIGGEFNFILVTYPNQLGGLSEKELRETLAKALKDFEAREITDDELRRTKNSFTSGYYGILETIGSKASVLTQYEMLTGGNMDLQKDIDRYSKVTKADVMRVYNTYIKNKNYSCVHIKPLPQGVDDKKKYESVNPYANEKPDKSSYSNLVEVPNVDPAGFDRSKHPVVPSAKPVSVPNYYSSKLDNGIKIIGTKSSETPKVYMSINIKGGHLYETDKVKNGTAAFLAAMMNEGTVSKTPLQLENMLKDMGSTIRFGAGEQNFSVYVECYRDSFMKTMAVLEDMFFNPRYDEKEYKLIKKAILGNISSNNIDEDAYGSITFRKFLFGDDNPIGELALSKYSVADKIKIDDAKAYKEKFLSPNQTSITVVGDISETEVNNGLSFFKKWENKNLESPKFSEFPPAQKTQIYLINKPNAPQSSLTLGYRTIPYDINGDFFKASVMNFALGGSFNSRLNLNLREDKGWTYGIRSGFRSMGQNTPGVFIISAGVKTRATDSAISEIFKELNNYITNGITDDELEFTKNSLLGQEALQYESPFSKISFLSQILNFDLPKTFVNERAEIIKNLTKDDLNALAKKYLDPENMVILVVGDEVLISDKLKELGMGKIKVIKMPK